MNRIKLRNGDLMPMLGLGTSKDDPIKIKSAVLEALKIGYRLIDTAFFYQNENHIGESLSTAFKEGILKREDVFVITKLPPFGHEKEKVPKYLKSELEALQLSYVDLYLIHMPTPLKLSNYPDICPTSGEAFAKIIKDLEIDYRDHLETWGAMEECLNLGLTRAIGLSNFNSKQVQNIYENCTIKPANLQVECHIYLQQDELFRYCKERDITFTAYSPIGSPAYKTFMKKFPHIKSSEFPVLLEDDTVIKLGKKYSKTPAQIALRWLLQRGISVIPKSTSRQRLKENFDIFDFSLNDEDMAELKALNKNQRQFDYKEYTFLADHKDYPFKDEIPF